MLNTKKFTILHSNDMHGDFLAEVKGEKGNLIGGLALLSGYINKVRKEEENVLTLFQETCYRVHSSTPSTRASQPWR